MKPERISMKITLLAMFAAIIIILAIPGNPIGFVPLPVIRGTTIHIPVIIGSILLGPKYGAVLGFMFGLTSLFNNTFNPTVTSFVFSPFYNMPGTDSGNWLALIVTFVPRILVGVVPWFVYAGIKKILANTRFEAVSLFIAGIAGSLTNTLLVMHFIFVFFGEAWNSARAAPADFIYGAILSIIAANGIPEAILAGILTAAVCVPLKLVYRRRMSAADLK